LSTAGQKQAQAIADLLPLYGPDRVVSAPQVRCRDTIAPLADALGLPITDEPLLSEPGFADDPDATLKRARELAAQPGVTVVCSQGGVIPDVVAALARDAAVPVDVEVYVCGHPASVARVALRERSLVVLGGRRSWLPTPLERLQRALEDLGHIVMFVNQTENGEK